MGTKLRQSSIYALLLAEALCGVLPTPAVMAAGSGLALSQLGQMRPVSVSQLLAEAGAKRGSSKPVGVKTAGSPKDFQSAGREGADLQVLLSAQPLSLKDLMAATNHRRPVSVESLSVAMASRITLSKKKAVAIELPKTVKAEENKSPTPPLVRANGVPPASSLAQSDNLAEVRAQPQATIFAPASVSRQSPDIEPLRLKIELDSEGFHISPKSLVFLRVGSTAKIEGLVGGPDLSLFVRDQGVVSLDQKKGLLISHKRGVTELYAVSQGKMFIVPLTVEDGGSQWDLKVPDALVSLDGIFKGDASSISSARASFSPEVVGGSASSISLRDSIVQTEKALADEAQASREITLDRRQVQYDSLSIQVIDDRSNPKMGRIYPAANVDVRLVGTELKARTDATGHVTIRDVPRGSRFQIRLDDTTALLRPGLAEVESKDGVARIRMMRSFVFEALQNIIQSAQDMSRGSYCGIVVDAALEDAPVPGVRITLDVPHEGPFYFNRYGFPDRSQAATGSDGRFCYLNVLSGPAALTLTEVSSGAELATVTVPIHSGRHVEDEITIGSDRTLQTRLFTMASASEQLSGDQPGIGRFTPVDMVDLIPLGTDTPMEQVASGVVKTSEPLTGSRGRVRALVRAAEFESGLYQYGQASETFLTPLIPRGFVEDLALYAQVTHDSEQGAVLVAFGHPKDVESAVNMRLLDQYGRDVGDGWYFSDAPLTKAMFFNVPPGVYTVLVETKDRYWLAADSVYVYNETVSYVNLGSQLRYRSQRKRANDGN